MRNLCLLLALACAAPAAAQYGAPDPKIAIDRIKAFDKIVGSWTGLGWAAEGGERREFSSSEVVTRELDGTLLMVRGVHRDRANPARIVHNALGLISWDMAGERYEMRSYLATGMGGTFPMELTSDGFAWAIDSGPVKMRYRAVVTPTTWTEDGERSMDGGKSWTPFFHMSLTRN